MAYIPVCIGLCSALAERPPLLRPGFQRAVVAALLMVTCLVGLPFVLGLTAMDWADRDYRCVEALVQAHVHPDDHVYCDGAAYYAVKQRASVETGFRHLATMAPRQKDRVSVLVIEPARLEPVQRAIGGRWRAVWRSTGDPRGWRRAAIWRPAWRAERGWSVRRTSADAES